MSRVGTAHQIDHTGFDTEVGDAHPTPWRRMCNDGDHCGQPMRRVGTAHHIDHTGFDTEVVGDAHPTPAPTALQLAG